MRHLSHATLLFVSGACLSAQVTPRNVYDAIRQNDLTRLQTYLKESAAVNLRDPRGATPLMYAARSGSLEAMQLLLKAGADVNAKSGLDATALIYGALDPHKTKLLLDSGAEVNVRTKMGRTPLLMAASRPGNAASIRMLLTKGADTAAADVRGNTALVDAARVNDLEAMKLLVGGKADINAGDIIGITALGYASAHSNLDAVKLLLAKGADVNVRLKREIPMRNGIIAASYITALMASVGHGSVEVVKALLDAGADIAARDVRGMTPLMWAVASDEASPKVIRLLLDRGSDRAAKSTIGETALDWARKFNHPEIVAMLGGQRSSAVAAVQTAGRETLDARRAIERALPLLESTSVEYFKQSGCVGCHHQDMIGGASAAAARKGLAVNASIRQEQLRTVTTELGREREALLQNMFISVDGNAFLLAMLAEVNHPADESTDALVSLLASQQNTSGNWGKFPAMRPPLESSPFVGGALAVRAMAHYAIPARKSEFDQRIAAARQWLTAARPHTSYEHYYRLMGLKWSSAGRAEVERALADVRRLQRSDGGFPQTAYLASDAFATGAALIAMREAGVSPRDAAVQRAARFLLANQREDGSWHVPSRSPKFQPYFQSGFPHDHDQWISAAASALAVNALAGIVEPVLSSSTGQ